MSDMAPPLPLSSLRAFEAAVRTGSYRAAAEELALTPSAVSHAMRRLEHDLGTALFRRHGRQLRPTAEGEALAAHVARGFGELRTGLDLVGTRRPTLLRLHSAPSFAAQWLAPRLARLIAEHPGLEVRLAADTDYTQFRADEFDADIVYGPPRQTGLTVIPLGEEILTPLCAPALAGRMATPGALAHAPLIESDNKQLRWPDWFAANGLPAPSAGGLRFDRSFLALAAAADGLGVALESPRLAEREIAAGRLVAPLAGRTRDLRYVGHHLVFPRGATAGRALRTFIAWLLVELGLPAPGNARRDVSPPTPIC